MKLWLWMSAVASTLAAFNAHAIDNCQELMRVIRNADFQPSIVKALDYNILEYGRPTLDYWKAEGRFDSTDMAVLLLDHPLSGSLRRLYCYSDVRYSDGTSGSVQYVLDRDPDGEHYWQLADFDRTEWQEWVDVLRRHRKDLDPERPWYNTWVTTRLVDTGKPVCPGCTLTVKKYVHETRHATKPTDWTDLPRF